MVAINHSLADRFVTFYKLYNKLERKKSNIMVSEIVVEGRVPGASATRLYKHSHRRARYSKSPTFRQFWANVIAQYMRHGKK